jgi:hypothetical protein
MPKGRSTQYFVDSMARSTIDASGPKENAMLSQSARLIKRVALCHACLFWTACAEKDQDLGVWWLLGCGEKGIAGGDYKTDNNNEAKTDGNESDGENSGSERIVS